MAKIGKVTVHYPETKEYLEELEERYARLYARFLIEEISLEAVEEVLKIHDEKVKSA